MENTIVNKFNKEEFLNELFALYEKYNVCISHEDSQGNFILEVNLSANNKEIYNQWITNTVVKYNETEYTTIYIKFKPFKAVDPSIPIVDIRLGNEYYKDLSLEEAIKGFPLDTHIWKFDNE